VKNQPIAHPTHRPLIVRYLDDQSCTEKEATCLVHIGHPNPPALISIDGVVYEHQFPPHGPPIYAAALVIRATPKDYPRPRGAIR
jgi:hypothetical protein